MKLSGELSAFCDRIGHRFADPSLIIRAVTHASMVTAHRDDNQRLEFLGDRVLGLTISEALLKLDCQASEGELAPRFNTMVRKETCAEVANDIKLGDALLLGRSEMLSGGRRKQALLGDAMEAVIAAIYLDAGFEKAREVILKLWGSRLENAPAASRDGKTLLQEWAQARGMTPPFYKEVERSGPDHAPLFTVLVTLDSGQAAQAQANSKRAAQQAAAEKLFEELPDD